MEGQEETRKAFDFMLNYVGKLFPLVPFVLYFSFLWIITAPIWEMMMETHLWWFGHVRRILIETPVRRRLIGTSVGKVDKKIGQLKGQRKD